MIVKPGMRIRITHCTAFGKAFENLISESEHLVIKTPKHEEGTWVQGVGEPVRVFLKEYEIII